MKVCLFFLWVIRMWIHYPVQTGVHKHAPIAPQGPEHSSVIGEVNERGKREYARKKIAYGTVLNTCLSFLNEVMAREPLSGERSDAVKVSGCRI